MGKTLSHQTSSIASARDTASASAAKMAADFGVLVAQQGEEGLEQRTNGQEKGLKKPPTIYHRVLGVPHGYRSRRGIPQDRSTSIFIRGDSHMHLPCLKQFLLTISKWPLHYCC